jgi:hypothetical protein
MYASVAHSRRLGRQQPLVKNAAVSRGGRSDLARVAGDSKVPVTPNHERSLMLTDNPLEDAALNRARTAPPEAKPKPCRAIGEYEISRRPD